MEKKKKETKQVCPGDRGATPLLRQGPSLECNSWTRSETLIKRKKKRWERIKNQAWYLAKVASSRGKRYGNKRVVSENGNVPVAPRLRVSGIALARPGSALQGNKMYCVYGPWHFPILF